jgi:hypothetical protein
MSKDKKPRKQPGKNRHGKMIGNGDVKNDVIISDHSTYAFYPQLYMNLLDSNFHRLQVLENIRNNLENLILDPSFVTRLDDKDKLALYRLISIDYGDTRDFTVKIWDTAQKNNLMQKMIDNTTNKDKVDAPSKQSDQMIEIKSIIRQAMAEKIAEGESIFDKPEVVEDDIIDAD